MTHYFLCLLKFCEGPLASSCKDQTTTIHSIFLKSGLASNTHPLLSPPDPHSPCVPHLEQAASPFDYVASNNRALTSPTNHTHVLGVTLIHPPIRALLNAKLYMSSHTKFYLRNRPHLATPLPAYCCLITLDFDYILPWFF